MDKAVILSDAVQTLTQLRDEAQKLKESSDSLQEKINELKVCLFFYSIQMLGIFWSKLGGICDSFCVGDFRFCPLGGFANVFPITSDSS